MPPHPHRSLPVLFALAFAMASHPASGAEPSETAVEPPGELRREWTTTRDGRPLAQESVRERVVDGRIVLTSAGAVPALGLSFTERLELDAGTLAFRDYRLDAATPGGVQVVEAARVAEGVRFHVVAGGRDVESTAAVAERPLLLLDNLVFAHYEALGRILVRRGAEPFDVTIAVPQVMQALAGRIEPGERGRARGPDGEIHEVREARLIVGGLLTSVWYDAVTGDPWRVSVPVQAVEARAAGWHSLEQAQPDAGAQGAALRQLEVTFESELGAVAGTLALPLEGEGPFPAVLLLAGSGPQDRDETVGPNKPLRDLAADLAARGVASLRFDKRAWSWKREAAEAGIEGDADRVAELSARVLAGTLHEEYLADGVAALRYLAARPEVRDDALFVLGHSLGALVAPEIARALPGVRGVVLLGAMGRPFETVFEEQVAFQQRALGLPADEAAAIARATVEPLERVRRGELGGDDLALGAGAGYWRDLLSRDPLAVVSRSSHPILLLHAGKDVQVRDADFEALRATLAAREGVPWRAERFAELNHLFMLVEGEPTGAEYGVPGRVDPVLARTIAEWIVVLVAAAGT